MPDTASSLAPGSYPGLLPAAPVPPAIVPAAIPAAAPALGLNLGQIILIVSGDVQVTSSLVNITVQRR